MAKWDYRDLGAMIVASLLIAGVATFVWPPSSVQLAVMAAGPETPSRNDGKISCVGQAWPYIAKECLRTGAE